MNPNEIKLLTKMKKLIKENKRRFENRKDRNYLEDLLEIGITPSEAWNQILSLNHHFYFPDTKASYRQSKNTLVFKKPIHGILVYIKLKIEINNKGLEEIVICLSFHIDKKRSVIYEMSSL